MANKTSNGQGAGWPSKKKGNPSGKGRDNNPPKTTSRPNTSKK